MMIIQSAARRLYVLLISVFIRPMIYWYPGFCTSVGFAPRSAEGIGKRSRRAAVPVPSFSFTGDSYVWPWKGNVKEGTGTAAFRDLFPIPSADLGANPTLVQNPGYQ